MLKLALAMVLLLPLPLRAQELVVLVRHGQKADRSDDPPLAPAGEARAQALAHLLRDAGLTAIYTSERRRTQETAAPLAGAIGVKPQVHPARDTPGLLARVAKEQPGGRVLIVGHSNTVPALAAGLGLKQAIEITEDDYDDLLIVVPRKGAAPRLLRLRI